jgi:methionyl-tRNA formyltransferase
VAIEPDETAGELADRLARLGAEVLVETLARLDELTPRPQRDDEATLAPRLRKSDGHLDWDRPAAELVDIIRGSNPWPGASTLSPAGQLIIWRARAVTQGLRGRPGALWEHEGDLVIAAADGAVLPLEVQPESKRRMAWPEYLRGARLGAGAWFRRPASAP